MRVMGRRGSQDIEDSGASSFQHSPEDDPENRLEASSIGHTGKSQLHRLSCRQKRPQDAELLIDQLEALEKEDHF